jgi:hypothetical protein
VKTDTTPKIADRGTQSVLIGHSKDHDADCYEMWYPKTNRVYTTRDVMWLNRMYYPAEEPQGMKRKRSDGVGDRSGWREG